MTKPYEDVGYGHIIAATLRECASIHRQGGRPKTAGAFDRRAAQLEGGTSPSEEFEDVVHRDERPLPSGKSPGPLDRIERLRRSLTTAKAEAGLLRAKLIWARTTIRNGAVDPDNGVALAASRVERELAGFLAKDDAGEGFLEAVEAVLDAKVPLSAMTADMVSAHQRLSFLIGRDSATSVRPSPPTKAVSGGEWDAL